MKSIHDGVKCTCDQCDYKATRKGSLVIHIKSKHNGVKFPSNQCDNKATVRSPLFP